MDSGFRAQGVLSQRMRALDWVFPCHEAESLYAPWTVAGGFFSEALLCSVCCPARPCFLGGDRGISMTGASNLIPCVV